MGKTNRMNPHVRIASSEDSPGIIALFDEVRAWANSRGYEQSIDHLTVNDVAAKVDAGCVYLCDDGDVGIAGSFTLTEFTESVIDDWQKTVSLTPEIEFDLPSTLHLNHLAVARRRRGERLGICILDRACEITREMGKSKLFLGCWAGNVKLREYYTLAGFHLVAIARKIDDHDNCSAIFIRDC